MRIPTPRSPLGWATAVCVGVSELLLCGAVVMQETLGLVPCPMCMQQRYALYAAIALGVTAWALPRMRWTAAAIAASAGAMLTSAAIAVHQLGAERGWWKLHEPCSASVPKGGDPLAAIMAMPMVRCDAPQWRRLGLTLADLNAGICVCAALAAICMLARWERRRRMHVAEAA